MKKLIAKWFRNLAERLDPAGELNRIQRTMPIVTEERWELVPVSEQREIGQKQIQGYAESMRKIGGDMDNDRALKEIKFNEKRNMLATLAKTLEDNGAIELTERTEQNQHVIRMRIMVGMRKTAK